MSLFGPSFSPPLNLFSNTPRAVSPLSTAFLPRAKPSGTPTRAVSPLSTAFTPNRSLTHLSTAFTQSDRGVGYLRGSSSLETDPTGLEDLLQRQVSSYHVVAASFRLFGLFPAFASFIFKDLPPLFPKHPGMGIPGGSTAPRTVARRFSCFDFRVSWFDSTAPFTPSIAHYPLCSSLLSCSVLRASIHETC